MQLPPIQTVAVSDLKKRTFSHSSECVTDTKSVFAEALTLDLPEQDGDETKKCPFAQDSYCVAIEGSISAIQKMCLHCTCIDELDRNLIGLEVAKGEKLS